MRQLALLSVLALWPTADALACGGFFCNRDFPIDQAGESIVFGVDEDQGVVTSHVSIAYEGASEDFAWIVPVPKEPELFTSSDALFSALSARTKPQFWLNWETNGVCDWGFQNDAALAGGGDTGAFASPESDGGESVTVVAQEQVGPYDTVVLQATDSTALLTWLNDAGYDLPNTLDSVLTPYLADRQFFVALKLSAGRETGDLVPLGMRYAGNGASIPIQLTSVAATPDMPLTVYVLGEDRAVPDNYLHVTINDAAVNWFDSGSNYSDVISIAADEAGGHAFATDFSGATADMRGSVFNEQYYDADALRASTTPFQWLDQLLGMGLPPSAALLETFKAVIPYPAELAKQDISAANFYDCLECYSEYVDSSAFDANAATDILETRLIDGLREAELMLASHGHMTRMTSSLDAVEMTVDPQFVFNGDLPQTMSHIREATLQINCGIGEGWDNAERVLILADGREIPLPSQQWVENHDTTEFELMSELTEPAGILVEDYGDAGDGEVMLDYREEAATAARRFNRAGCGCSTTSPMSALGVGLLLLPLGFRRRN
ncbi:MAG: DUF2330 domain-containing protein [Proteobacteria bacterium]|nr:DUF2330 domain-containing protein [Pseudomonadota bacterium]